MSYLKLVRQEKSVGHVTISVRVNQCLTFTRTFHSILGSKKGPHPIETMRSRPLLKTNGDVENSSTFFSYLGHHDTQVVQAYISRLKKKNTQHIGGKTRTNSISLS